MTDECYFCDETASAALEHHHIVPRRYGGSDESGNLVVVCATCHRKLEDLYDDEFYETLGIESASSGGSRKDVRERRERFGTKVKATIAELSHDGVAPVDAVVDHLNRPESKTRHYIELMLERGELYLPSADMIAVVPEPEGDRDD